MSAMLSTILWPAVTKGLGGLSRLLGNQCGEIASYLFRRSAISSLCALDDRALRDIGLVRSQIETAVHGLIAPSRPTELVMTASSATIGSCANGQRHASIAEAVTWS